ncbi:hypothetical protein [Macrococcoides goetzii]|nr:hypothetical protein [Macrococcus goetzii]
MIKKGENMDFKGMFQRFATKGYKGIPVTKENIITKKEKATEHFEETFKVLDFLDREKIKRKYTMNYEDQIEVFEKHKHQVKTEAELDFIEDNIKKLKRKVRFNGNVTDILIPDDKIEIIINNYKIEDKKVEKVQLSKRKEIQKVNSEIQKLVELKEKLSKEERELEIIRNTASVVNEVMKLAKSKDGVLHLTSPRGTQAFTSFEVLRGSYKPYKYYNKSLKVDINE